MGIWLGLRLGLGFELGLGLELVRVRLIRAMVRVRFSVKFKNLHNYISDK